MEKKVLSLIIMSNWFKIYQQSDCAKLRLFCFPYAGGSAQIFSKWSDYLPESVDLFAIQAPGRGRRFSENPIACLQSKMQILHQEILSYTDIPYMFIGHSNGALLAYELARELQKSGNCKLQHIIISAKRAPHLADIKPPIHDLSQSQFVAKLKEYDFTPDEVLANDELMELFSPMLRADFALSETHDFDDSFPLQSDASLFWGNKDKDVPLKDMLAWQKLIDGQMNLIEFDDGHFFISHSEEMFMREVNRLIKVLTS